MKGQELRAAIAILKQGGVVVFPTETAYGLAADATNPRALRRIYVIKGRDTAKALPWIASDVAMVERYVTLSPTLKRLAKQHWPGPLTIVAPVTTPNPSLKRRGSAKTVAIRVSSHPIARALSKGLGRPIVSTSANLSGQPTCYSVPAFTKQLRLRGSAPVSAYPDAIINIGSLSRRKPSTIVTEQDGKIVVLRQGPIRIR